MFNISQIIEGWRNDAFPPEKLKDIIKNVSEERLAICVSCKAYDTSGKGCSMPFTQPCCNKNIVLENGEEGCGCPISKKSKALTASCPGEKWGPVVTQEEMDKYNLYIDGK